MDDLRNPIVRRRGLSRMWRGLSIVLLVLAVALPAATPVMAHHEECKPRIECKFRDGQVHWTAKGLENGTWKVKWSGSSGSGEEEFCVGKKEPPVDEDDDFQDSGCFEYKGSFPHTCGPYVAKLYREKDSGWRFSDKCEGDVECKEEVRCRTDVSVLIYGGWNGIPVKATVGGTPQETLYTALDAFDRPAVLWTFYPPEGETWTVVVTPELPAGLSSKEWKYEPASRTLEIEGCKEYQVTFQLIHKEKAKVVLPVTGGER